MPLVDYGDQFDRIGSAPAIDIDPAVPESTVADPSMLSTLGAAFRQDNVVGSTFAKETFGLNQYERDDGFNPLSEIKGTKYEARADQVADIFNRKYFDAWKTQVDREDDDRKTVEGAGWLGTGASAVAAILDLPSLIPGGEIVGGVRTGAAVARSAASVAVAGGVGAAVSEAGLQATQQTRTASESAMAIGSGIVFGGLLGGSVGAVMSRVEQKAAMAAIDRTRVAAKSEASLTPAADEMETFARSGNNSVGAARVTGDTLQDLSIEGRAASAVGGTLSEMNPILRSFASPSVEHQRVMNGMVENSVYLKMNTEGRSAAPGGSVETVQKQWDRGALGSAIEEHKAIYTEARKNGLTLDRPEFNKQIAYAMRRGDTAADPAIGKAAQAWRSRVFDPLKKQAIEVGLLPADVDVKTAESYLMRMWNPRIIEAKEGEFRQIATEHVKGQVESAVEKLTASRDARLGRINSEVADLELPADQRASLLESLPSELNKLRQDNARFDATDATLSDLRRQKAAAREANNGTLHSSLSQQIDTIATQAGQDYADFVSKRNLLQTRISRIRNNIAGRGDQVAALQSRIADTEAANIERLRRVHRSLSIIEEDIQRSSPEVWQEKLSAARTQFANVLERSNKAQDRLAKARQTAPEGAVLDEATTKFEGAEAKRISDIARLADRIGDIESVDPEQAVAELRGLIETRLTDAASLVQRETARMIGLAKRADAADPARVKSRVDQLKARAADLDRDFADRVEIGLDAQNGYESYVKEVVDGIYNTLTGRSVTDIPRDIVPTARGPLKERTFNIPDRLVEQFLENDIEMIGRRYARTMAADVELTRKYGSVSMVDQLTKVQEEYAGIRERVMNSDMAPDAKERALTNLSKQEKSNLNDMKATRDLLRGNYAPTDNSTNFARIARDAMTFNYLRSMGGVLLASLTDAVRPAMVHGLGSYLNDGIKPLITNMRGVRLSAKDAKLAGAISERILQSRMATLAELTDPYSSGSPFERFLDNASNKFSTLTGLNHWNDFHKTLTSVMTQNRVLKNLERGIDNLKPREQSYMGYLGLDQDVSARVLQQFQQHGETVDGVRVANTEDWTDEAAQRAYYAAINKDVDSIIVSKSVADVPLFMHRPVGKMLGQFKSFALAGNQRVLMRGLQESPARMVGGIAGMATVGMFIYALKQIEAGREVSNNPGNWIAEGLDRSGIFSIGFEINNSVEKVTGIGAYGALAGAATAINPAFDARQPASRFAVRGVAEGLAGPTFGLVNDIATIWSLAAKTETDALGITKDAGKVAPSDISTIRRLLPFASLPYWRWAIDNFAMPALKESVEP